MARHTTTKEEKGGGTSEDDAYRASSAAFATLIFALQAVGNLSAMVLPCMSDSAQSEYTRVQLDGVMGMLYAPLCVFTLSNFVAVYLFKDGLTFTRRETAVYYFSNLIGSLLSLFATVQITVYSAKVALGSAACVLHIVAAGVCLYRVGVAAQRDPGKFIRYGGVRWGKGIRRLCLWGVGDSLSATAVVHVCCLNVSTFCVVMASGQSPAVSGLVVTAVVATHVGLWTNIVAFSVATLLGMADRIPPALSATHYVANLVPSGVMLYCALAIISTKGISAAIGGAFAIAFAIIDMLVVLARAWAVWRGVRKSSPPLASSAV
jgi:hypothetical protein